MDFLMGYDGYSMDFSEGLIWHVDLNGYLGRSSLRVVPSVAERPGIGLVNSFFFVLVLWLIWVRFLLECSWYVTPRDYVAINIWV